MDIHDLKIFLTIAQEGSVSQAMQPSHSHLLSVRSQVNKLWHVQQIWDIQCHSFSM